MREPYIALIWVEDETAKPKREIIYAKSMYGVSKHIDNIYPKRKLLIISKANAFDIKKDDEVHTI